MIVVALFKRLWLPLAMIVSGPFQMLWVPFDVLARTDADPRR